MTSEPSTSSSSLNIGILGHVDSGKTSLTKRIAEFGSTSAFDAHATTSSESSEDVRRNTLDLGFSTMKCGGKRMALIDCPGHSGLIRAVLAASTVFDMAILVIDAISGIQPQTAEHLLLASLFCPTRIIVVLNKIDLAEEKNVNLEDVKKKVRKGLKSMGIPENSPIVEMSLLDGKFQLEMLENLKLAVESKIFEPERETGKNLLMAIDHCFSIKGKGTVLTGTVIQGVLRLSDEIEFPSLQEKRRLKSLETWKCQVQEVSAGERAAFLVAHFDTHRFSRCLIARPGVLRPVRQILTSFHPIQFFRGRLQSKMKIHISVAFETLMAELQFLRPSDENGREFEILKDLEDFPDKNHKKTCVNVLLTFEKSIFLPENFEFPFMASRLEQQPGKGCRFAFSGKILKVLDEKSIGEMRRFTRKERKGTIDRIEKDGYSVICTGMFKAETNFQIFQNFMIVTSSGKLGKIDGAFGKSGKFRVTFSEKISEILAEKEEISLFLMKYSNNNELVSYVPNLEEKNR